MKVRSGFVSNSSTSSFCIYGVYFEESEKMTNELVLKLTGKDLTETRTVNGCNCEIEREQLAKDGFEFCPKCGSLLSETEEVYEDFDVYDAVEEACDKLGLECSHHSEEGLESEDCGPGWIIGYHVSGRGGRRAAKKTPELLEGISAKLKQTFGEDVEIDFWSGTVYG